MGVYTILVEPKPTVQVKRNEPDANDDMDVESSYKRSRLAEKHLALLLH